MFLPVADDSSTPDLVHYLYYSIVDKGIDDPASSKRLKGFLIGVFVSFQVVFLLYAVGVSIQRFRKEAFYHWTTHLPAILPCNWFRVNMPPQRGPMNVKGLKTERTHEENQERAYIAASRRSDRSLEARIESARRASEIHKKRTGRSLRVTEQDVINEEMYEEEDDDLQSQYRRLQAHLGSSADMFSGRLNSWILSQYGTRQMAGMGMPMGGGFMPGFNMNMQQPMAPFFAYNPQSQTPTGTMSPQASHRGQSFRSSPYPGQQYARNSISSLQDIQVQQSTEASQGDQQEALRRHSVAGTPETSSVPGTPVLQDNSMQPPMPRMDSGKPSNMLPGRLGHPAFFNDQILQGNPFEMSGYPMGASSFDPMMTSPLSTNMPVESQQLLGTNAFDSANPYAQLFMNQDHGMPIPPGVNYTYNPNLASTSNKMRQTSQSEGINQTLSPTPATAGITTGVPSKLDTNVKVSRSSVSTPLTASTTEATSALFSAMDGNYTMGMDFAKSPGMNGDNFFADWVTGGDDE